MKNNTYQLLLQQVTDSPIDEICSAKFLWNTIFQFLERHKKSQYVNHEEYPHRNNLLKFFATHENLINFDYKDLSLIKKISHIDIIEINNIDNDDFKKLIKFVRYHQEEVYKEKLINKEFSELPQYFILLFSKFTEKEYAKPTARENKLKDTANEMINYFIKNDISKLKLITSFYDINNLSINYAYKIINRYKQTELKNDCIAGFLDKYIMESSLYPHNKISLDTSYSNNEIFMNVNDELFTYFKDEKSHWEQIPLKSQAFLFHIVYINFQARFSENENEFFKNNFIEYVDKVSKNNLEGKAAIEIFSPQNNLSVPILEYYPMALGEIFNDKRDFNHVENNFQSLTISKTAKNSISLEFPDESDDFLFKTLFVNMMLFKDYDYHNHLAEIYKPHILNSSLLETSYISDQPKSIQNTLDNTYKAISNLQTHLLEDNTNNLCSTDYYGEENLFTALLWVNLYHNKTSLEDYENFLLLRFFNQQNRFELFTNLHDIHIYNDDWEEWIDYCIKEIPHFPIHIIHSMGDTFNSLKAQSSIKDNEPSFLNNLRFIRSRIREEPDYSCIDNICHIIEEKIIDDIAPKNKINNKTHKF